MPRFLLFTLYAPLGSFGEIAVGERRTSFSRPARSAVLGMIAGALGIDRSDEDAQSNLDCAYGLILRADHPGTILDDYHTIQSRPARRNQTFATRREALATPLELETLLSVREYRCDPLFTVALLALDPPGRFGPEQLNQALRSPTYTPYMGRKACPLGLPLRPLVVEKPDAISALSIFDAARPLPEIWVRNVLRPRSENLYIAADIVCAPCLENGFTQVRIERRRDQQTSRRRWQFALRDEVILKPSGQEAYL
jgi:CRISPR system Cascade subunit CasD